MQERHKNRKLYFDEQSYTTSKYVIPYISKFKSIDSNTKVLEIGCGEGGNLKPFVELGCQCVGIDLNEQQIRNAELYFSEDEHCANTKFIYSDIYDIDPNEHQYDVVMLRDVIEHIHNQERFMTFVKGFMKPDGVIFFAFPPWFMPFGGHQQICVHKISKIPFIHLFTKGFYKWLLKTSGENDGTIESLLEIKETGITIERFERIVRREKFTILDKTPYFINPNYEIKFHLRPRKVWPVFRNIPYLRNFYTTAGYYLLKK